MDRLGEGQPGDEASSAHVRSQFAGELVNQAPIAHQAGSLSRARAEHQNKMIAWLRSRCP
jgi:hypothetical protein